MKAVGIVSGGLDSLLAVRLVQRMGFEVLALHFLMGFEAEYLRRRLQGSQDHPPAPEPLSRHGVEWEVWDIRSEFLKILARPQHGLGANLNPCIDCKILMLSLARARMESEGAAFAFTGEVLGQRPMSQRRQAMDLIAKKSGLEDRLVRPLCGGLLPPTAPEKKGLLHREQLGLIRGRGRTDQMILAAEMGIHQFPTPAGGCLLTDPAYASRAKDLQKRRPAGVLELDDPPLLLVGRHVVLPGGGKAVIGRREPENSVIESYAQLGLVLLAEEFPGPSTLVEGLPPPGDLEAAARLTARYGKGKNQKQVAVRATAPDGTRQRLEVAPIPPDGCRIL